MCSGWDFQYFPTILPYLFFPKVLEMSCKLVAFLPVWMSSILTDCLDHDHHLWGGWISTRMLIFQYKLLLERTTFSLRCQTINLLLAVQELINGCIYFVLQKMLHFYPFCLSCNCTSTPSFANYLLSCALCASFLEHELFSPACLFDFFFSTPGLRTRAPH